MTIIERIQLKAKEKRVSISTIEKEAGISNGVIRRWEKSSPQCDKIAPVANYLNVSLDWLILGKDNITGLSDIEQKIISAYRAVSPEKQEVIRDILKVSDSEPESEVETSSEYKIG